MTGTSKNGNILGYNYFIGVHFIMCHGTIDSMLKIRVDQKEAWVGVKQIGPIYINKPSLFGGEALEGGVVGRVHILAGYYNQGQNIYLKRQTAGIYTPAYRGVAALVLEQVNVGMNPFLKPWTVTLKRIHLRQDGHIAQWYDAKSEIILGGKLTRDQNFCFSIDCSTSMSLAEMTPGVTRFQYMKDQLKKAINEIYTLRKSTAVELNIAICAWNSTSTLQEWLAVDNAKLADIMAFIDYLGTGPGTDFREAVIKPQTWLLDMVFFGVNAGKIRKNTFVLITDGEPNPIESAVEATWAASYMLNGQIFFALENCNVNMYAINIALENVQYTQMLDNTPSDTVPVVTGVTENELSNIIFFSTTSSFSGMNPAHIIYECLTDPKWGMGYLDTDIDETSFMNAADKLFEEYLGLCIIWDTQSSIEDFIAVICRHIDAVLYVDRKTGLFVLKLIRDDYDPFSLLIIDPSNTINISDFSKPTYSELVNTVTVSYNDFHISATATVTVQDIALIEEQGGSISVTHTYEGIADPSTASRIAQRDLRVLSTPIISCTLIVNRIAENLNIGDCFKLTWPDYNLNEVIMRVSSLSFGDGKSNQIRIVATQDVFKLPETAFIMPPPPQWQDPASQPAQPAASRAVFEVPYLQLVQSMGQSKVDTLLAYENDMYAGFVGGAAVKPSKNHTFANLYTNNENLNDEDSLSYYRNSGVLDFCPGAILNEDIAEMNTTFAIIDLMDQEKIVLGTWFQMDKELMSVESITETSITVKRAVLDTVPIPHTKGAALVFWDNIAEADPSQYEWGDAIGVRIQTNAVGSQLNLSSAPEDIINLEGRAVRPYPPGNVKVNGLYFPKTKQNKIELTWASRNKELQTSSDLVGFTDGNISTDPYATTYIIFIKNAAGDIVHEARDISALFYNVPANVLSTLPASVTVELYTDYVIREPTEIHIESLYFHSIKLSLLIPIDPINMRFIMDVVQTTPPAGDGLNFVMKVS